MNDIYNKTKEATVSQDIAYARGEMGRVNPYALARRRRKKKKKRDEKDPEIQRYKKRQEAIMETLPARLEEAKNGLVNQLAEIIQGSKLTVHKFVEAFRSTSDTTPESCLIRATHYDEDMNKFRLGLPADLGELELILVALEEKKSLDKYSNFARYKQLYGARVGTRQEGFNIIYEGLMTMDYTEKETLYISDLYIVQELANRIKSVKVSHRMIYPVGAIFDEAVYPTIMNIIKEGT